MLVARSRWISISSSTASSDCAEDAWQPGRHHSAVAAAEGLVSAAGADSEGHPRGENTEREGCPTAGLPPPVGQDVGQAWGK